MYRMLVERRIESKFASRLLPEMKQSLHSNLWAGGVSHKLQYYTATIPPNNSSCLSNTQDSSCRAEQRKADELDDLNNC